MVVLRFESPDFVCRVMLGKRAFQESCMGIDAFKRSITINAPNNNNVATRAGAFATITFT